MVPAPDGKLTPDAIETEAWGWGDEHRAQPLAVRITQTTELGTVYTPDEVRAIADFAHERGMAVHMDGARIWNAAAALGLPFRAFTADAGVDLLSLGGTKNGAARRRGDRRARPGPRRRADLPPQAEHAAGEQDALHERAAARPVRGRPRHPHRRPRERDGRPPARRARGRRRASSFSHPTQANAVFAELDLDAADRIRERFRFYDWDRAKRQVRWMCALDTTEDDVDAFVATVREALA